MLPQAAGRIFAKDVRLRYASFEHAAVGLRGETGALIVSDGK